MTENDDTPQIIINPKPLDLCEDLKNKLFEMRSKRDAVSINHSDLKKANDKYNKIIIILSLTTALTESVKVNLDLTNNPNPIISSVSSLAPIFLSTAVSIISSLLKFKKYNERMEQLITATEKCSYSISRLRGLIEILSFEERAIVKASYINEVLETYKDGLTAVESSLYPKLRQSYYKKAQDNLVTIRSDAETFQSNIDKINEINENNDFKPIPKEDITYKEYRKNTPYPVTNIKDIENNIIIEMDENLKNEEKS